MRYKLVFRDGRTEKLLEYGIKDEVITARTESGFYRQKPAYSQPDRKAKVEKLTICNSEIAWADVSKYVDYIGVDTDGMVRFEIKIGDIGRIVGGVALPEHYSLNDAIEMIYRGIVEEEPDTVNYSICAAEE